MPTNVRMTGTQNPPTLKKVAEPEGRLRWSLGRHLTVEAARQREPASQTCSMVIAQSRQQEFQR